VNFGLMKISATSKGDLMHIVAYTDGASSNNSDADNRCGGWGVVILYIDDKGNEVEGGYKTMQGTLKGASNNMMELEAIRRALMAVKKENQTIIIHSDSEYAIGVLSKGWKAKANENLVREIKTLMFKHTVTFEWVQGHAGHEYNEKADKLATQATQRCTDDMDDSDDVKRFGKTQQSLF
jgi:ribonuclease HI